MSNQIVRGTIVLTAGGVNAGILTGGHRPCTVEGCTGLRLATRWPDGRLTFPCTEGMAFDPDHWEWRGSVAAHELQSKSSEQPLAQRLHEPSPSLS
jgi:hypothetical protein